MGSGSQSQTPLLFAARRLPGSQHQISEPLAHQTVRLAIGMRGLAQKLTDPVPDPILAATLLMPLTMFCKPATPSRIATFLYDDSQPF